MLAAGVLSALLVNDTICLMLTPLVVAVMVRGQLPLPPYLLALAMSANLGSVATLVGNPQNMIIGNLSGLSFLNFSAALLPVAASGLALEYAVLRLGIVVESARGHCEVGFWDYARYGIPVTLLTTVAGMGVLLALG